MCEGSLEPVAERVFGELPYDAFLVEWDDLGRDGGLEPIRFLRDGSTMVMGLISTKTPIIEDEDDLLRNMEEAASIAGGMDRLAISPQVWVRLDDGRQRHGRRCSVAKARTSWTDRRSPPGAVESPLDLYTCSDIPSVRTRWMCAECNEGEAKIQGSDVPRAVAAAMSIALSA